MTKRVYFRKLAVDANDDETISELCERIGATAPKVRVISKGRILHGSTRVGDLPPGTQLRVFESSADAGAFPETRESDGDEAFDAMEKRRKKYAVRVKYSAVPKAAPGAYRFREVRELEGLPDQAQARRILEELANDRGVVAVLEKHKWTVGCLSEMYPDGKVGVDPVCVLGLNVNKGQEIKLRLRTDDLRGFRHRSVVRKTLFHELAHNVHSEHDGAFNALMRQVEREATELDWTRGVGRRAGGSQGRRDSERFSGFETGAALVGASSAAGTLAPSEAGVERVAAPEGGSGRLGGEADLAEALTAREAAAVAAAERALVRERAVEEKAKQAAASAESGTVDTAAGEKPRETAAGPAGPAPGTSQSEVPAADGAAELLLARLHAAAAQVRLAGDARTPRTLATCLRNALEHASEERYRRLRAANRTVQTRILQVAAAVELLRLAGWRTDTASGDLILPPSADPTRLYLARSALEGDAA